MERVNSLSFFFPAYNEEATVESMIREGCRILPVLASQWEIIPVNDGSSDGTGVIIDRLAMIDSRIHPVHHKMNKGYGGALISGFSAARYDWVFFTDGDRQFDLQELSLLLDKTNEADLVLGYRRHRSDPVHRRINAFLWGLLVSLLFRVKVRDVNCAFKLIRRDVLKGIDLTASGAAISTELLIKVHRAGFRFLEVEVSHYPRLSGMPTGAKLSVILRAFQELFRIYREQDK
jgi:glycosyltransferase involved in cell wall biosynthesis